MTMPKWSGTRFLHNDYLRENFNIRMLVEPRTLQYVATATGGIILQGDPAILLSGIRTDSRSVTAGDLFIAISGEHLDGHHFLNEAWRAGAAGLLVHDRSMIPEHAPCILVENTRIALGKLGAAYRQDFQLPMIAVGGANGKTTTKELIASVLRRKGPTLWSEASFNNDLGVPLTLLRLETTHHAAVLEAGTNHPGELAPLLLMIQPKYGVITSIGREHLEFFGDVAGVAREEGTIAEELPEEGLIVVHGDSPEIGQILQRAKSRILKVGSGTGNDWRLAQYKPGREGSTFQVETDDAEYRGEYQTKLLGKHQALNAIFAIVLGQEFGLTKEQVQAGLWECAGPKMRLQIKQAGRWTVLDDSYNANPDSMAGALETLRDYPGKGKRIAVLGDMGELGLSSEAEHSLLGCKAAEMKVDLLVVVGKFATEVAEGARGAGVDQIEIARDVEDVIHKLGRMADTGDVILVKASRSARFERIVAGLIEFEAGIGTPAGD
jgi:UDP-N-acetylmuramoyl-tripeptide--D-alanyl-D-alanine ligase